jgi:hypothetical protein
MPAPGRNRRGREVVTSMTFHQEVRMSRSFKLVATVMVVSICSLYAAGFAAADSNPTYFAKVTGDGRGVAIVELRGKKKVCVTASLRDFEPDQAEIKVRGKKGKIKMKENGKRECDKEKKLAERLQDGEGKGKEKITLKGAGNDKSDGKLRAGAVDND